MGKPPRKPTALAPVANGALNESPAPTGKLNENTGTKEPEKKVAAEQTKAPAKRKRASDAEPDVATTTKRPKRDVKKAETKEAAPKKAVAAKKTTTTATKTTVVKKTTTTKVTKAKADAAKKPAAKKPEPKKAAVAKKEPAKKEPAAKAKAKAVAAKKKDEKEDEEEEEVAAPKPKRAAPKPKVVQEVAPKVVKPAIKVIVKKPRKGQVVNDFATRPETVLTVLNFGEGEMGELGHGPKRGILKRPQVNPFLKPEDVKVVSIAVGGMHTLCLTKDNKIYSWGVNDQSALGRSTEAAAPTREVKDNEDVDDAASDDSEVEMNPLESTPGLVENLPEGVEFVKVAAGDSISVAVTSEGEVWQWGTFRNDQGIMGFYHDIFVGTKPTKVEELADIVDVCCGTDHVLALSRAGKVYSWGNGQQFQIGRRVVDRRSKTSLIPMEVGVKGKIIGIAAGSYHSFAIDDKRNVWAWGLNQFMQCGTLARGQQFGIGGDTILDAPTKIAELSDKNIKQVIGGGHHSLAVSEDGTVYFWGKTGDAEGMDLSTVPEEHLYRDPDSNNVLFMHVPTPIPEFKATFAASGKQHVLAIGEDKQVYSWGYGGSSQTGHVEDGEPVDDTKKPTKIVSAQTPKFDFVFVGASSNYSLIAGVPRETMDTSA